MIRSLRQPNPDSHDNWMHWFLTILGQIVLFASTAWLMVGSLTGLVPLFASWTIAVVHLVATFPLGIVLATLLPFGKLSMSLRWCGTVIASVLFWVTALAISDTAQKFPLDYWMLWFSRVLLCTIFQCLCVACYSTPLWEKIISRRLTIVPIAFVVLILPATFGLHEVYRITEVVVSSMSGKRVVTAFDHSLRLLQLDSSIKIDGVGLIRVARDLRTQIRETEELLTTKQSTAITPSQAVMYLLSLSRVDEAEALRDQLPSDAPDTMVLGILIARELNDWELVRIRCLEYVKRPPDEMRATVLNALAEAHGNQGDLAEAIQVYHEMINKLPSSKDQAIAHFRLGLIHLEKGDSAESWEHLNQAIALDPSLENEAKSKFTRLKNFSCQLRGL